MMDDGGSTCTRIGIISDTHGLYRPQVADVLRGVSHIFHAGDIGKPLILKDLEKIAPVTAVLGNIDIPSWYPALHKSEVTEIAGKRIMLLHNIDELDLDPKTVLLDAIIYGHTHKPHARQHKGIWHINPGSAGPHRFMLPVSVAIMTIDNREIMVEQHTIHA